MRRLEEIGLFFKHLAFRIPFLSTKLLSLSKIYVCTDIYNMV